MSNCPPFYNFQKNATIYFRYTIGFKKNMNKNFINGFKKFLPFLGISGLYFLFILLIVLIFNYYSPNSLALSQHINPYYLLLRWDSLHYLDIIIQGYASSSVFFPLYPLIVAAFSIFFSPIFSGFLVSFLSLAAALYYLSLLLEETGYEKIKNRVIILLLLFPTAMFFPLIYTESLFLFITVAFFYALHKHNWLAAVFIGFLASLTRNVGIFLWPVYIVYLYTSFYGLNTKIIGRQIISLSKKKEFWFSLIIPAGLLLYCLFTYLRFGYFFAFLSGQNAWTGLRSFMWPGATLYHFFRIIFIDSLSQTGLYTFLRIVIFEGGAFLLLLVATIYWLIKKNWPYAVLCLLNTLLFSCFYPMLSVNRYVVVIFPVFIFLAALSKKYDWLFYTILLSFSVFFIFNIFLFSGGSWVG